DEVGDDANLALVRGLDELAEVVDAAVVAVDRVVVGDVVAAVPERRRVHRQQPDAVDPEPLQVVELLDQPAEVARAIVVAFEEAADVDLVEDGALEPERVLREPVARLLLRDCLDLGRGQRPRRLRRRAHADTCTTWDLPGSSRTKLRPRRHVYVSSASR